MPRTPPIPFPLRALGIPVITLTLAACAAVPQISPSPTAPPVTQPASSQSVTPSGSEVATPSPTLAPLDGLSLEVVADGLSHPLDVRARPADGVLFVAEQGGVIRQVSEGASEHPAMLDISEQVNDFSIEQGLLGFAFHPDYPDDPRVFVYHSLPGNDNVLASFETTDDPDRLDPGSRRDLLVIDKDPDRVRHNGGGLRFGPDGMLYLSLGDAERAGLHGQDPATLQSSILRLDVDSGEPYAIPPDNPFVGGSRDGVTGAPEVWWYGLRNPWRYSFDLESGLAYVADVGQERAEEINVVPLDEGGINFGWPSREGRSDFLAIPLASEPTDPVIEIVHGDQDRGCSVTGGEVYRGPAIPELSGHYFYADWCHGWIRSFLFDDGQAHEERDWSDALVPGTVSAFGTDADGEILVLGWDTGTLSRIAPVRVDA